MIYPHGHPNLLETRSPEQEKSCLKSRLRTWWGKTIGGGGVHVLISWEGLRIDILKRLVPTQSSKGRLLPDSLFLLTVRPGG